MATTTSFQQGSYAYDDDIAGLLDQLGSPQFKLTGKGNSEISLCCVIPGHQEKKPSLGINRIKGVFKCYGCGHGGGLKKFAELCGLVYDGKANKKTYNPEVDPFAQLLNGYITNKAEYEPEKPVEVPNMLRDIPNGWTWRGMDGKFLNKIGAKLWYDEKYGVDRVWLPGYQNKELVGWFARVKSDEEYEPYRQKIAKLTEDIHRVSEYIHKRRKKGKKDDKYRMAKKYRKELLAKRADAELELDTLPKYRNNYDMKAQKLFYPWDFIRKHFHRPKTLVLVEGQVDALFLVYNGIPAVAIFGTNNWTPFKESMVVAAGFQRIVVAMDGDKPGRKARKKIYKALKDKVPECVVFKCPKGTDPATLPPKKMRELKRLVL